VVALRDVAPRLPQHLKGYRVLDTLSDHEHAQLVTQLDGAPDDRRGAGIGAHVRDEAPVELKFIDRQSLKVGQRRVASAVVVDGEQHAERPQPVEDLTRPLSVGHQDVLGDLQHQRFRGDDVDG
jgi:hypothetical protein